MSRWTAGEPDIRRHSNKTNKKKGLSMNAEATAGILKHLAYGLAHIAPSRDIAVELLIDNSLIMTGSPMPRGLAESMVDAALAGDST